METKKKPEAPKTRGWYTHTHARTHAHMWEKKQNTWHGYRNSHVYYKCVKKAFFHASIMNKGVSRRAEDKDGYGWGGGGKEWEGVRGMES